MSVCFINIRYIGIIYNILMATVEKKKETSTSFVTKIKPFLIGSLSGSLASTVIQPIDTVKVASTST